MGSKEDIFSPVGRKLLASVKSRLFDESSDFDKGEIQVAPSQLGCHICSKIFVVYAKWRLHYKTKLHAENLRRKMRGKAPLTNVGDDVDEISSSEESTSSDREESETEEMAPESDTNKLSVEELKQMKFSAEEFFVTVSDEVFSIQRCLLPGAKVENFIPPVEMVKSLSQKPIFVVLMLAAGRFAGCVFNGNVPVVHKSFVRYTVRAKQGGGQSGRDSQQGGSHPKSAGAALRRYNEKALAQDIQQLLTSWADHLKSADFLFLRCSKPHRRIFFDSSNFLSKTDSRLKTIPITTYRPSYEEICRVHRHLIGVCNYGDVTEFKKQFELPTVNCNDTVEPSPVSKFVQVDSTFIEKPEDDQQQTSKMVKKKGKNRKKTGPIPSTAVATIDEENLPEPSLPEPLRRQIFTACRAGDAEELRSFYDTSVAAADESAQMAFLRYLNSPVVGGDNSSPTLLHLAAYHNHKSLVRLLLELGADPTLKASGQHFKLSGSLLPYQVCSERPLRQIFVDFRRDNPDVWDFNLTQIPEPLDPEAELKRQEKLAEKRRKDREGKKLREKQRKEEEKVATAEQSERQRFLALSDREKRALAAERRILALCTAEGNATLPVLKRCHQCAKDLSGAVPFEYGDNVFCCIGCLKTHRNKAA